MNIVFCVGYSFSFAFIEIIVSEVTTSTASFESKFKISHLLPFLNIPSVTIELPFFRASHTRKNFDSSCSKVLCMFSLTVSIVTL